MGKGSFQLGLRNDSAVTMQPCFCTALSYTAPQGSGAVTKTRAQILADAIAKIGITAPTGFTFDLQNATVGTYQQQTEVTDFTTQTSTATAVDDATDVTCNAIVDQINPMGQKQYGGAVWDADGDGDSDNVLPADFQVVIQDGSAVEVYACITPTN